MTQSDAWWAEQNDLAVQDTYRPKPKEPDYITDEGLGLTTLDSAEVGLSYEWDEIQVLRGSDGYLYVVSDSGCSCNSFGSYGLNADYLHRVDSWQMAAFLVRQWARLEGRTSRRESVGMQLIERLTNTRPAAFDPTVATVQGEVI